MVVTCFLCFVCRCECCCLSHCHCPFLHLQDCLSHSPSVCLCVSHWYAPASTLRYLLSMSVCLSAFPSLVCSRAFYFVPNSPHDHFVLVFHSFFSLSYCLIVAFFVSLSAQLCLCLCLLFFSNLCFYSPRSPGLPSFLPRLLLLLLFTAFTESQGGEKEKNKKGQGERVEQAPFSSPEPSKHLCLLFTTKMAELGKKTTGREMLGGNQRSAILPNWLPSWKQAVDKACLSGPFTVINVV